MDGTCGRNGSGDQGGVDVAVVDVRVFVECVSVVNKWISLEGDDLSSGTVSGAAFHCVAGNFSWCWNALNRNMIIC